MRHGMKRGRVILSDLVLESRLAAGLWRGGTEVALLSGVNESMITSQVLQILKTSVSAECFTALFSNVRFRRESPAVVSVMTPTRYLRVNLEKNYRREIMEAVRAVSPGVLELQFCETPRASESGTSAAIGSVLANIPSSAAQSVTKTSAPARKEIVNVALAKTSSAPPEIPLSPSFKLENFENGTCNNIARAAAETVIESPGKVFNPLFVQGAHGMGKTHLLQGLALGLRERSHGGRVVYVTGELFANGYIEALQRKNIDAFRAYLRDCSALIFDDIHFLEGKTKTQEELLHTVQYLRASGRQIAFGSCRPLSELAKLNPALLEIIRSGLVLHLDTPEFELRIKLLFALAKRRNWMLEAETAQVIATHVDKSVGALEGVLCKTFALAYAAKTNATPDLALVALQSLGHIHSGPLQLGDILDACAKFYRLTPNEICSDSRGATVVHARHIAMHLCKSLTTHTTVQIGRFFGNRDHTSVLHACRKITALLKKDDQVKEEYRAIKQSLGR